MNQEKMNDTLIKLQANFKNYIEEQKRYHKREEENWNKFWKKEGEVEERLEKLEKLEIERQAKLSVVMWLASLGFFGGGGTFIFTLIENIH